VNAGGALVVLPDGTPEAVLQREVADADLLLMCYAPISKAVIDGATRLKAIVKYGVGIDAIDIDAARARGIPVVNVPAYAEETVAEGAFSLLMALFKRFKPIQAAMQRDGWIWPESRWLAHDLAGRTLGLVGLGRIGRSMARMAGAFRMQVLAYDPNGGDAAAAAAGVERCTDLHAMLARCDAVSIHATLNPSSRHLIGAAQLAAMKPTAVLVNVSRGEIVDEAALLQALQAGRLAGRRAGRVRARAAGPAGPPAVAAVHDGQRAAVAAPDLLHARGDAAAGRRHAGRCFEALAGQPVTVKSGDPRLLAQTAGVRFER
jgi:D-3-phosphoglycerate dehydrogenase